MKSKKKKRKLNIVDPKTIEIELPDKLTIQIYKKELKKNIYLNRGYILDGFPETYYLALKIFKKKKQKPKQFDENGDEIEEEESGDENEEENEILGEMNEN